MTIIDNSKKLLCIVGSMNAGGAETFLMKIYRNIDRSKYQFDFYVSQSKKSFYDDEITALGGVIIRAIPKSQNPFKSFISIFKIVKEKRYKSVLRISQHSLSSLDLLAARLAGAKILVFRSSNSKTGGNRFNSFLHHLFRPLAITIPNIKLAPSHEAAKFMFGKNYKRSKKTFILKNGIPIDDYKFSNEIRVSKRSEFNISDKFVVGHIGRFTYQKNHEYLIEIFERIFILNKNSILVLIGTGELEESIKSIISQKQLTENVIFLGVRNDVPLLLMAFDLMIFPSFFEGLPNVLIEAQATGLKCIVSETISKEVKISNSLFFEDIQKDPGEWANKVDFSDYIRTDNEFPDDFKIEKAIDFFVEKLFY